MTHLVSTKIVGKRGAARKVLRDWRIVALEENRGALTFLDLHVFTGVVNRHFDKHGSLVLPGDFIGRPLLCQLAPTKNGDFQDVPLHVKVADAVSVFGIYVRYTVEADNKLTSGGCGIKYQNQLPTAFVLSTAIG